MKKIIDRSNFLHKLFHWEYWPFLTVYLPVICYYVILSFLSRSFLWFSTTNPGRKNKKLFGDEKWDIIQQFPSEWIPKTVFVPKELELAQIIEAFSNAGIEYPCFAKPDIGEQGWQVKKLKNDGDLQQYLQQQRFDFLIQEAIMLPLEVSIFYIRLPKEDKGKVTGLVIKEMLSVEGNGHDNLQKLIQDLPRARFQWKRLKDEAHDFTYVPVRGEKVQLSYIGNHCKGAIFYDGSTFIDDDLHLVADMISKKVAGFYYGRYDIKCTSLEDLKKGQHFKIIELNGVGSEPTYIYDPNYRYFKAQKEIMWHMHTMWRVAMQNHRLGNPFLTFRQTWRKWGHLLAHEE